MEKPHKRLNAWKESIKSPQPPFNKGGRRGDFPRQGGIRGWLSGHEQFLYIARGSISEVDTYLEVAQKLGYFTKESIIQIDKKMTDVDKMLTGLIYSLRRNS